jgi:hypothetical protein
MPIQGDWTYHILRIVALKILIAPPLNFVA